MHIKLELESSTHCWGPGVLATILCCLCCARGSARLLLSATAGECGHGCHKAGNASPVKDSVREVACSQVQAWRNLVHQIAFFGMPTTQSQPGCKAEPYLFTSSQSTVGDQFKCRLMTAMVVVFKWRLLGADQGHGELTHLDASVHTQGLLLGCSSFLETLRFLSES